MKTANSTKLPKIGDRIMRVMTVPTFGLAKSGPEPCIVIYVNKPKYYYTVEFIRTGLRESFKVPDIDEIQNFKDDYERVFGCKAKGVYVYESCMIYPSIKECAEAIGVTSSAISKHLHGGSKHVKGYHIHLL